MASFSPLRQGAPSTSFKAFALREAQSLFQSPSPRGAIYFGGGARSHPIAFGFIPLRHAAPPTSRPAGSPAGAEPRLLSPLPHTGPSLFSCHAPLLLSACPFYSPPPRGAIFFPRPMSALTVGNIAFQSPSPRGAIYFANLAALSVRRNVFQSPSPRGAIYFR